MQHVLPAQQRSQRPDDGFSLLELVVAVSIMLVLAVVGFVAYQGYTDNARDAAVEHAANDVFTSAHAQHVSYTSAEIPDVMREVEDQYNESAGDDLTVHVEYDGEHITVTARGWENHIAVRSTDLSLDGNDDAAAEIPDAEEDMNTYDDGEFTFSTGGSTGQISFSRLSDNAVLTRQGGSTNLLPDGGDGTVSLSADSKYTFKGGFMYVGDESISSNISHVHTWEDTGTRYAQYMFKDSPYNIVFDDVPPEDIRSMRGMFENAHNFNQDISAWELPHLTDLRRTFSGASSFNQDISDWDTTDVTTMSAMFQDAASYNNGDESLDWDTSKVQSFYNMFDGATVFNADITSWDMGSATSMREMFQDAVNFNQDIGHWQSPNNESLRSTFERATKFDYDISDWDMSSIITMNFMFNGATAFNNGGVALDWDTPNLGNNEGTAGLWGTFQDATSFNQDISSWDTTQVTGMRSLFQGASNFNQDLTSWETPNNESLRSTFQDATAFNNGEAPGSSSKPLTWDTSKVTNMNHVFQRASSFNQDVSSWQTGQAGNYPDDGTGGGGMVRSFYYATSFTQDVSMWDTSNVGRHTGFAVGSPIQNTENIPSF